MLPNDPGVRFAMHESQHRPDRPWVAGTVKPPKFREEPIAFLIDQALALGYEIRNRIELRRLRRQERKALAERNILTARR